MPAEDIHNGTKLRAGDAEAGVNFLTPTIEAIARAGVAEGHVYETLDATRLYRDLLSSMPMAFNLFGEASLPEAGLAWARLAERFGVAGGGAEVSDIVFEWSPSRRDPGYTNDRTAFDVAIRFGDPNGPRTIIGIETKYHEHAAKEKAPGRSRLDALRRLEEQTEYLVAIAEQSGVFKPGWQNRVLDTECVSCGAIICWRCRCGGIRTYGRLRPGTCWSTRRATSASEMRPLRMETFSLTPTTRSGQRPLSRWPRWPSRPAAKPGSDSGAGTCREPASGPGMLKRCSNT